MMLTRTRWLRVVSGLCVASGLLSACGHAQLADRTPTTPAAADSPGQPKARVPAGPGMQSHIVAPTTARVGDTVSVRLWAGGSGSRACNTPSGLTVTFSAGDTVHLQPWFATPRAVIACTMDFVDYPFDTTLVFPRPGRWVLIQRVPRAAPSDTTSPRTRIEITRGR